MIDVCVFVVWNPWFLPKLWLNCRPHLAAGAHNCPSNASDTVCYAGCSICFNYYTAEVTGELGRYYLVVHKC